MDILLKILQDIRQLIRTSFQDFDHLVETLLSGIGSNFTF